MARVHGVKSPTQAVDLDALFVWSTMHGLAGILSANCTTHLTLSSSVHKKAVAHVMGLFMKHFATGVHQSSPPQVVACSVAQQADLDQATQSVSAVICDEQKLDAGLA